VKKHYYPYPVGWVYPQEELGMGVREKNGRRGINVRGRRKAGGG
jgi:hypothetical protein